MMNAEAPYCDACGCQFPVSQLRALPSAQTAIWTRRALAIACGLLAASIAYFLYA
jgi:RNA polymerase-binding transcription factor DksA